MLKIFLSLALAFVFGHSALADEASVKKAIEAKLGGKVNSVKKTPYLGLYEIYGDGQIFYTDEKITAILTGSLIDGKTMKNVTAERMQKLAAINFSELPLDLAIKQVRGDGKRVLATFEDPNCGYCKRFEADLKKIDNVTVSIFLIPILGEDSVEKSKNIWCSKDRAATWQAWMLNHQTPAAAQCDTSALERNLAFAQKYRINGTPAVFFSDGTRVPGAMQAQEIEAMLAKAP